MTRPSILAVIGFAALGSSCFVSTDASAFCHWYGGRYHSARPAAAPPAKQPSLRPPRLAAPNANGDGQHTVKGPGLFAEVAAAVACAGLCVAPAPAGTPVQGNGGGAGSGVGKTSVAASGDQSVADKTNGAAVTVDQSVPDKTNGPAVTVDQSVPDKTSGPAVTVDRSVGDKTNGLAASGDGIGVTVIGGKWTGIGAGTDGEDTNFRAIALGLSNDGAWVVRTAPTLATAGAGALRACSEQFGQCMLSDAQVAPTAFGCLVVIQSDDASRVFAAAGDSSDIARVAATVQIALAGLRGQIVFTGCNS